MTQDHAELLKKCEEDGLDMAACLKMSFRDLESMWADYQSDLAAMDGRDL